MGFWLNFNVREQRSVQRLKIKDNIQRIQHCSPTGLETVKTRTNLLMWTKFPFTWPWQALRRRGVTNIFCLKFSQINSLLKAEHFAEVGIILTIKSNPTQTDGPAELWFIWLRSRTRLHSDSQTSLKYSQSLVFSDKCLQHCLSKWDWATLLKTNSHFHMQIWIRESRH